MCEKALKKNKQIEEMAKILAKSYDCGDCTNCMHNSWCPDKNDAELIYNAGYRKASEVAEDVIDKIFKILDAEYRQYDTEMRNDTLNKMYMSSRNTVIKITAELAELKKKYAEGEDTE